MNEFEVKARLAKRCPMCGSERIVADSKSIFEEKDFHTVGFVCLGCGLSLRIGNMSHDYNEAYRATLKAWNRRTAV